MAVHRAHDCVFVFRAGLTAASLKVEFDEGTAALTFDRIAENGSELAGKIYAGYAGTALLLESNAVARRMPMNQVAAALLGASTPDRNALKHVA